MGTAKPGNNSGDFRFPGNVKNGAIKVINERVKKIILKMMSVFCFENFLSSQYPIDAISEPKKQPRIILGFEAILEKSAPTEYK